MRRPLAIKIEHPLVEKLPLNGRSLQPLLGLAPGVVMAPVINGAAGQFSVNGQRYNANYFMVDGVSANIGAGLTLTPGLEAAGSLPALTVTGGTQSLLSADEVEAVQIQTSTYAARYGRQPGAQIEFITRSGSTKFNSAR
jgi:hypothetical protein